MSLIEEMVGMRHALVISSFENTMKLLMIVVICTRLMAAKDTNRERIVSSSSRTDIERLDMSKILLSNTYKIFSNNE